MSRAIGLLILVAFICVGLYIGCGPRAGVAKDAAIKKIDELLGPLNVKQKEVEMAYADVKEASAGLRDKRIEAQVRVESLNEKKAVDENVEAKLISDLGKLKQMLTDAESTGSIERNGKEISIEQLKSLADGIVKQIKLLKGKIKNNDVITAAWAKNLEILKKNDDTSKAQLTQLENQLDQIRSKKSALDAMKEAATIAGPGASISDKFNELTADVDELLVNIDTELKIEETKIDERIAEVQTDNLVTLEELLDDKTDISSTMSEIDKLLDEGGDN